VSFSQPKCTLNTGLLYSILTHSLYILYIFFDNSMNLCG